MSPWLSSDPTPAIVLALRIRLPVAFTVEGFFSVSVCDVLESVRAPVAAPSVRLPTVGLTSSVTVYVPAVVISASSPAPGTGPAPEFQLAAVFQLPPPVLVQTTGAAPDLDARMEERRPVRSRVEAVRPRQRRGRMREVLEEFPTRSRRMGKRPPTRGEDSRGPRRSQEPLSE